MTFGEHLNAALQVLVSRDLGDQEMREFKAFVVGVDSVIRQKLGQGQNQAPGSPNAAQSAGQDPSATEDFGNGAGTPTEIGL